jgi:peptidase Do
MEKEAKDTNEPIKVETHVIDQQAHVNPTKVKILKISTVVNLALLGLLALLLVPAVWVRMNNPQSTEKKPTTIQQSAVDKNNQNFSENSISSVVEKVAPSVVSIVTASVNRYTMDTEQSGAGTGVILSDTGYILTNKHVVKNSTQLRVVTSDGETYDDVKVVFQDPFNDLAFLKVANPKNFKAIEIGDSKTVKVGQSVIAIGNSLGQYQNTVTRGIISGTNRSITAQGSDRSVENLTDMLQTDAAINPGNSGGPLVNAGGQLIGINTAVTQGANGLGFAIPISAAKGVIKQLGRNDDQIQRAMLGVRYIAVNPAIAKDKNLTEKQGALVTGSVIQGSSAEKAGLKEGDIIMKVNGLEVGKTSGLSTLLSEYAVGDEVELVIKRGTETITSKVKLQAAQN